MLLSKLLQALLPKKKVKQTPQPPAVKVKPKPVMGKVVFTDLDDYLKKSSVIGNDTDHFVNGIAILSKDSEGGKYPSRISFKYDSSSEGFVTIFSVYKDRRWQKTVRTAVLDKLAVYRLIEEFVQYLAHQGWCTLDIAAEQMFAFINTSEIASCEYLAMKEKKSGVVGVQFTQIFLTQGSLGPKTKDNPKDSQVVARVGFKFSSKNALSVTQQIDFTDVGQVLTKEKDIAG